MIGSGGTAIEVWSSVDGLAWQKEDVAGSLVAVSRPLIVDLAGRADAALAAGYTGDERPGVWTSP